MAIDPINKYGIDISVIKEGDLVLTSKGTCLVLRTELIVLQCIPANISDAESFNVSASDILGHWERKERTLL